MDPIETTAPLADADTSEEHFELIAAANEVACDAGVAPWPYGTLALQAVEPLPITTLAVPLSNIVEAKADPEGVRVNDGDVNCDELNVLESERL